MRRNRRPMLYKERANPYTIPDIEFRRRYRFKKSTVEKIVALINDDVLLDNRGCGTPVDLQVMVALRCWGRREVRFKIIIVIMVLTQVF